MRFLLTPSSCRQLTLYTLIILLFIRRKYDGRFTGAQAHNHPDLVVSAGSRHAHALPINTPIPSVQSDRASSGVRNKRMHNSSCSTTTCNTPIGRYFVVREREAWHLLHLQCQRKRHHNKKTRVLPTASHGCTTIPTFTRRLGVAKCPRPTT